MEQGWGLSIIPPQKMFVVQGSGAQSGVGAEKGPAPHLPSVPGPHDFPSVCAVPGERVSLDLLLGLPGEGARPGLRWPLLPSASTATASAAPCWATKSHNLIREPLPSTSAWS